MRLAAAPMIEFEGITHNTILKLYASYCVFSIDNTLRIKLVPLKIYQKLHDFFSLPKISMTNICRLT